jgi:hypothetical protein
LVFGGNKKKKQNKNEKCKITKRNNFITKHKFDAKPRFQIPKQNNSQKRITPNARTKFDRSPEKKIHKKKFTKKKTKQS